MSNIPPIAFTWTGETMTPRDQRAAALYEVGTTYALTPYKGRSKRSHDHYFACIEEAWRNLPDDQFARFTTSEHLRKFLLIKCGYCAVTEIACGSPETAAQVAALLRQKDEYALVVVQEGVIREYVAESQSQPAMGKKRFQESKQAVLDEAAAMIGVPIEDLTRNAGRAA